MKTRQYEFDNAYISETGLTYAECERIYGTSNMQTLNNQFERDAQFATDGNCYKWAIYGNGGIVVVVEC